MHLVSVLRFLSRRVTTKNVASEVIT